jgi:2-polyprenyl-3-methyl-5-hydroxy-6-metoxy-1,4-benzoquinol methylase
LGSNPLNNEFMNSCYLCNSKRYTLRDGSVRDDPEIKVLECEECGLVYLSSLNHIENDHYENSGMHDGETPDINTWLKETATDDERRYQFLKEKMVNSTVLDFGCGAGGFLDRAGKTASKVAGVELEAALQSSFNKRELSVYPSLQNAIDNSEKYNLITAFHVVEHLSDPVSILQNLSQLLGGRGEIIVEVPSSNDALLTLYNNEPFQNFTYWSQHLFLFNTTTIQMLIKKAGLKLNWTKHIQRYSLSNHLYWLAKGKPGGHKEWYFMESVELNRQYENQLATLGMTDTIMVGIGKI